jgi:hypothetical protein
LWEGESLVGARGHGAREYGSLFRKGSQVRLGGDSAVCTRGTQAQHQAPDLGPPPSEPFSVSPAPTYLASPSPETTSASLGPTVWQLPMAPTGRKALGRTDLGSSSGSAASAAPSLSRHPQRRRPPAPLCGRSPAGSVAAEGGAGMLREAGASALVDSQLALLPGDLGSG